MTLRCCLPVFCCAAREEEGGETETGFVDQSRGRFCTERFPSQNNVSYSLLGRPLVSIFWKSTNWQSKSKAFVNSSTEANCTDSVSYLPLMTPRRCSPAACKWSPAAVWACVPGSRGWRCLAPPPAAPHHTLGDSSGASRSTCQLSLVLRLQEVSARTLRRRLVGDQGENLCRSRIGCFQSVTVASPRRGRPGLPDWGTMESGTSVRTAAPSACPLPGFAPWEGEITDERSGTAHGGDAPSA